MTPRIKASEKMLAGVLETPVLTRAEPVLILEHASGLFTGAAACEILGSKSTLSAFEAALDWHTGSSLITVQPSHLEVNGSMDPRSTTEKHLFPHRKSGAMYIQLHNEGLPPPLSENLYYRLAYTKEGKKWQLDKLQQPAQLMVAHHKFFTSEHSDSAGMVTFALTLHGTHIWLTWSLEDAEEFDIYGDGEARAMEQGGQSYWLTLSELPSLRVSHLKEGDLFVMRPGTVHLVYTPEGEGTGKVMLTGPVLKKAYFDISVKSILVDSKSRRPKRDNAAISPDELVSLVGEALRTNMKDVPEDKRSQVADIATLMDESPGERPWATMRTRIHCLTPRTCFDLQAGSAVLWNTWLGAQDPMR